MRRFGLTSSVLVVAVFALTGVMPAAAASFHAARQAIPRQHANPVAAATGRAVTPAASTINMTDHGGPVEANDVHMHVIFWEPNGAETAYNSYMRQFLGDISGSTLAGTLVDYSAQGVSGAPSGHPGPQITLDASWVDTKSKFTAKMTKADFLTEVRHAMTVKNWSSGPGNVFLVFTGKGWNYTGLFDNGCAYHWASGDATNPVVYAVIPRQVLQCTQGYFSTPSGSVREDAAVNFTWHEVAEMLTDPLGSQRGKGAYFDGSGDEIGDVCEGKYPGVTGSNHHDITLNGHQYLVQAVWVNSLHKCSLDAPLSASPVTVSATQGTSFTGTVATFTDPDSAAQAGDFSALVTWPDGSFWSGTVQQTGPGAFSVTATHTFPTSGSQTIKVAIHDNGGSTGTNGAHVTVTSPVTVASGTLRSFTPSPSGNGRAMAFDPTAGHLFYTLYDGTGNIYVTDTSGNAVTTLNTSVNFGALAWDPTNGQLWGGAYDGTGNVYTIDPATGAATFKFTFNFPAGDECDGTSTGYIDGLAYDSSDGTLWLSDDGGTTLFHVDTSGNVLGSWTVPESRCNQGIAVANGVVWLAYMGPGFGTTPYGFMAVSAADPTTVLADIPYSGGDAPEGIAFDATTFAPTCALWSDEAGSSLIAATALPSCTAAGLAATPAAQRFSGLKRSAIVPPRKELIGGGLGAARTEPSTAGHYSSRR